MVGIAVFSSSHLNTLRVSTRYQEQMNADVLLHRPTRNYLNVGMEVHERPLAIFAVDP